MLGTAAAACAVLVTGAGDAVATDGSPSTRTVAAAHPEAGPLALGSAAIAAAAGIAGVVLLRRRREEEPAEPPPPHGTPVEPAALRDGRP